MYPEELVIRMEAEIKILRAALEEIAPNAEMDDPHDKRIHKPYAEMSFQHGGEIAWYSAGKIAREALDKANALYETPERSR